MHAGRETQLGGERQRQRGKGREGKLRETGEKTMQKFIGQMTKAELQEREQSVSTWSKLEVLV